MFLDIFLKYNSYLHNITKFVSFFVILILISSVGINPLLIFGAQSNPDIIFQDLRFVDENRNIVPQPDFCKPYGFTATIKNSQQNQRLKLLVTIQDENGLTVSSNWIDYSQSSGQPYFPSSWLPGSTGNYKITAYLYDATNRTPETISVQPLSINVTITQPINCVQYPSMCSNPSLRNTSYPNDASKLKESLNTKIANISIPFIENRGQTNKEVKYYSDIAIGTVFVTDKDLTYRIGKNENNLVLKETFLDGQITPIGQDKTVSKVNYFIGSKENWISNVDTYDEVGLGEPWKSVSVDLKLHGNNIEKTFTVYPGGNLNDISLAIIGANLSIDDQGKLLLDTDLGMLSMSKPYAYQEIDGMQKNVPVSYVTDGKSYGFEAMYNPKYPLVIDPLLASTFLGGASVDYINDVIVGENGCVYVTGQTRSTNFPTVSGSYRTTLGGNSDVFVSAFDSNLSRLVASSYIGGTGKGVESSVAIDVDGNENVIVTGFTGSPNFPTTNGAYDTNFNGVTDAFVFKMNNSLSNLLYSTLIGGQGNDAGWDVVIGPDDNTYITGYTESSDYPALPNAYDNTYNEGRDGFVSRLNSDLSSLQASTFVGGSDWDWSTAIGHDSSANIYIAGLTQSSDFPITSNTYDETFGGNSDGFVSRLNSDLSSLQASTFLGGSEVDIIDGLSLDFGTLSVYVAGYTESTNFPVTANAYDQSTDGTGDGFISKLNLNLSSLTASTFVGSDGYFDRVLNLDFGSNVVITGYTNSPTFPVTNAFQTTYGGNWDGFVSVLDSDLSTMNCSTYLGGNVIDFGESVNLVDETIFVAGGTDSTDFPVTANAYDQNSDGTTNGFVSKLTCEKNNKSGNPAIRQEQSAQDGFTMSNLKVMDGNKQVKTTNVGTPIAVSAVLQNNLKEDKRFAFYVVIVDEKSKVVFNSWLTGTAVPGSEYVPSLSWTPENPGIYTINTTVRPSTDSMDELASPLSTKIRVN